MTELAHGFLDWVAAHPGPALALLFFIAALDAVFIVGAFVPAGILLFGVGALIGLDRLELWPAVLLAASGAVLGDALSFWLGRHYGERLFEHRWLARYPEALARSRRFFARHGGKGVMAARFLGPVRAITPALAGASRMPAWLFLLADGVAAVAWAFAYLGPGIAFGASLELAAEVAGRLALLVLGLFLLALFGFALARGLVTGVSQRAERWVGLLLDYSRRHRRLGRFGAALADPNQPETPVLAGLSILLTAVGAVLLVLALGTALRPGPMWFDAAIYQGLRELRSPWGVDLAAFFVQLGDWRVYGGVVVAVLIGLALQKRSRAAAHWLAAAVFGAVMALGMGLAPLLPPPFEYFGHAPAVAGLGRDLPLVVSLYGFLPVLLATGRGPWVRALLYGVAASLVTLLTLGRLYLGMQWTSQALIATLIGLAWAALLGLGYRRHRARRVRVAPYLLLLPAAIALAFLMRPAAPEGAVPEEGISERSLLRDDWWSGGWDRLPAHRIDLAGRARQPLNLQWAAPAAAIEAALGSAGWTRPPSLGATSVLRWLVPRATLAELPVLPQAHAGRHQTLLWRRDLGPDRQATLRLWRSGYRTERGEPIWIGMLAQQRQRDLLGLLHVPMTLSAPPDSTALLLPLPRMEKRRVGDGLWLLRPAPAPESPPPPAP